MGNELTCEHARSHADPAPTVRGEETIRAFKKFLERRAYPCLGAKSALSRNALEYFCAQDICQPSEDQRITSRLQLFAANAQQDDVFLSIAVFFASSPHLSELEFEQALWRRLRAIHEIDRAHHGWDTRVSADSASRDFSMSVGSKGFFVVGLHPRASRLARRFQCPVIVFNLHSQFVQLRADGRYEKLSSTIIARDIMFSGSSNPVLANYGERSEARQYSGRRVEEDWVCPFPLRDEENTE